MVQELNLERNRQSGWEILGLKTLDKLVSVFQDGFLGGCCGTGE
jgi:hypothetical protein